MNRSLGWSWWSARCGVAVALLLWAGPAVARPLAQVRFSSLQAVLADTATVAAASGRPVWGEKLLADLLGPFGLRDLSMLDATRPLAVVLPVEGMLLQQRGVVLALPVTEARPLFHALAGSFGGRGREGDLEVFSDVRGSVLYAREQAGYVVAGQTPQLVTEFDLSALTTPLDGPPGNVMAELFLEPLAPLIQAGLVGAREQFRQQVVRSLSEPQDRPPGEPTVDAAAVAGMVDLYLGAVQTMLMDLSRVQLGLQLRDEHLLWHNRVVARPGTDTAEFVAHQGGGLPSLSRVVSPGVVNVAGQVKITPRLQSALAEFLSRYVDLVGPFLASLTPADLGGAEPATATVVAELNDLLTRGLDCFTGEVVASLGFTAVTGLDVAEAVGTVDTPRCRDLTRRSLKLLRSFPAGDGGTAMLTSGGEEMVHGITVERINVDLGAAAANLEPEEHRVLRLLYGGATLTNYVAATGAVTYYTLGSVARAHMQSMLGAADDPLRPGIDAGTFAPLEPGPGMYLSVDLPKLLSSGCELLPVGDPERARLEQMAQVLEGAGTAGRAAVGLTFDPKGATLQVAVPLRALAAGHQARSQPGGEATRKE